MNRFEITRNLFDNSIIEIHYPLLFGLPPIYATSNDNYLEIEVINLHHLVIHFYVDETMGKRVRQMRKVMSDTFYSFPEYQLKALSTLEGYLKIYKNHSLLKEKLYYIMEFMFPQYEVLAPHPDNKQYASFSKKCDTLKIFLLSFRAEILAALSKNANKSATQVVS